LAIGELAQLDGDNSVEVAEGAAGPSMGVESAFRFAVGHDKGSKGLAEEKGSKGLALWADNRKVVLGPRKDT
jgi:hypothetical protein